MDRILTIMNALAREYPRAVITLKFENPLQLLISAILSAQSTDERVNQLTPHLFKKYRTCQDFAAADPAELEEYIRLVGLYRMKAHSIIHACQKIVRDYNREVPQTMEELLTLPGVGRKTANVILSNAFGKQEGIIVDTHVKRLSQRLGLTREEDPVKIEKDLTRIVPREEWLHFANLLLYHGRLVCRAHTPDCRKCVIKEVCPSRRG